MSKSSEPQRAGKAGRLEGEQEGDRRKEMSGDKGEPDSQAPRHSPSRGRWLEDPVGERAWASASGLVAWAMGLAAGQKTHRCPLRSDMGEVRAVLVSYSCCSRSPHLVP